MIHSFSCKNFYSFCDETNVSFVVNDKTPITDAYFKTITDTRLSKIETIIGPNASGKTNLLKILPFLKWLITDSLESPSKTVPVLPFLFNNNADQLTELSVEFELEKDIYLFACALSNSRVLSEELRVRNKTHKKTTSKKLFSRNWNKNEKKYEYDGKNFELPKSFENLLPERASVIAIASVLGHKRSVLLTNYWRKVETNVIEIGWVGDHLTPSTSKKLDQALHFYDVNKALKTEAEKLLKRFDLGLDGFDITKDKQTINARAIHTFGNQKKYLPIQYESSGTKQLLLLLKTILQVLSVGGVAIIDEFDVSLHPEMVLSLVDLFIQPETNPHNAQLLFSTHSHIVLSKLDKYQIVLVEKNKKGISESWRLDEVSGVRADDNYYTKYLAGAYGAIPKIN